MARKKASDFLQKLLDIFDHYVHGEMGRRDFLDAAQKYAAGGLTAMALWEPLRPNYAFAQQVPKDDSRLRPSMSPSLRHMAMEAFADISLDPRKRPESFPLCS